jgi:hypothetical protein
MLLLEGNHFEEDAASVYTVVTTSTFNMMASSYIKRFKESRDGRQIMLALKLQFGGKAYVVSRSKATNAIIRTATFSGPSRQYMHKQTFPASINELKLHGDPIQEHIKVQLFFNALQEAIMSQPKMAVQLAPGRVEKS